MPLRTPCASIFVDGEAGAGVQRHTPSVEAYELFLRGRFFANKRTEDALVRAAEYFQQAIAIDPRFARAYVGLADTYIAPRHGAPAERFERARDLVTTALALDSTLAEAHTSMGWIRMWYDRNWSAAERHLQRAMALDPGYLWAQQWHAAYLGAVGRLDQSFAASQRAQQLDPLSVNANTHVGTHLLWLGRYDKAVQQYRIALELDPNFFMARWGLSRAYLELGRYPEAMRECSTRARIISGSFAPPCWAMPMPSPDRRRKRDRFSPSCVRDASRASTSRRRSSPPYTSGWVSETKRSTGSSAMRRTAALVSSSRLTRSCPAAYRGALPAAAASAAVGVSRLVLTRGAHHRSVVVVTAVGTCVALRATASPQGDYFANCMPRMRQGDLSRAQVRQLAQLIRAEIGCRTPRFKSS